LLFYPVNISNPLFVLGVMLPPPTIGES